MKSKEIALGVTVCGILAAVFVWLDAFDLLYEFTRAHEDWELDEIILAAFSIFTGAILALAFAARRQHLETREAQSALKNQRIQSSITVAAGNEKITKLEEMTVALSISEQRFRDFASAASDRFWELDAGLRYCYVSEPKDVTALPTAEAMIGKRRWDLVGADPDRDPFWALHREQMEARQPFEDFRYHHVGYDGVERCWSVSGKPIFDPDGVFMGYRGLSKDITAAVEHELALKATAEQADLANSAKSEFLANMSHELRTPLNAIIGFSQVIKDKTLGPDNAKYRDYAADIHDSGQHLLALINDILDLSKIEAGKDELHENDLDIAMVVAAAGRLVEERAMESDIAIAYELEGNAPLVYGDLRKLKQILVNLLSNAVKFSDEGGMVTIKTRSAPETGFVIQVVDRGIGMAPEDIPKALMLFGQIDAGPDRNYDGTGLGLPLAKALAEQHGGNLELQSGAGNGTTATVTLPAERLVARAPKPSTGSSAPSQRAAAGR